MRALPSALHMIEGSGVSHASKDAVYLWHALTTASHDGFEDAVAKLCPVRIAIQSEACPVSGAGLHIRPAVRADVPLILELVRALAIYEREEHAVKATEADLARTLFDDGATAHSVICELDGVAMGFAVYFFNYSTWLGRNGLYLEDLFVRQECRGQGAGLALLRYLAALAVSKDCGRFEWSVLDWNKPAIDFYRAAGAKPMDEWTIYRMDGQALIDFARGSAV